MAFVDRNSKHPLNRLLMFLVDVWVLLRRRHDARLVESIERVRSKRR